MRWSMFYHVRKAIYATAGCAQVAMGFTSNSAVMGFFYTLIGTAIFFLVSILDDLEQNKSGDSK
jgi:hypothetical protein